MTKKTKEKKTGKPATRVSDRQTKANDEVTKEELFGVHIISEKDTRKHLGMPDDKSREETPKDKT